MTEEQDLSPALPHDEEELNNVPIDINSDHGDDETEDDSSELEGSDAPEDGGGAKKKRKKKVAPKPLYYSMSI